MATFKNYFHNEHNNFNDTTNIEDRYTGGTERVSEIRVVSCEYRFLNGEHFYVTTASLSGNCNGFGGLGFKAIHSKECRSREEADCDAWKKVNKWLKKNEGFEVEVEK